MRKAKIDFMTAFTMIITVFIMVLVMIANSGCAEKTVVVTKYKYVQQKCPRLTVYKDWNKTINLTAFNKDGKICIKEWNGCIDKNAFIDLAKYIENLKKTCAKYQYEIKEYNSKFVDNNKTAK